MSLTQPKLLVFDLDYTLWPFWVDTHVTPPFRKRSNGVVVDAHNCKIKYYPEVPEVLKKLKEDGFLLAVASRTSEIKGANQLLELFGWDKYFDDKQIFPGCKVTHFNNIKKSLGVEFNEMIFFDDEHRNIADLTKKGVLSILVKDGVGSRVLQNAFKEFSSRQ